MLNNHNKIPSDLTPVSSSSVSIMSAIIKGKDIKPYAKPDNAAKEKRLSEYL